jgi:hypothetical protein
MDIACCISGRALRQINVCLYALWGVSFSFLTAGAAAWTNIQLKCFIEMMASDGQDQAKDALFWVILVGMGCSALCQVGTVQHSACQSIYNIIMGGVQTVSCTRGYHLICGMQVTFTVNLFAPFETIFIVPMYVTLV